MQILMPNTVYNHIVNHCLSLLPNEACGILLGKQDEACMVIHTFIPMLNTSSNPKSSFEFDPHAWIRLLFEYHPQNLVVIGIIHSHPTSAATPSSSDVQTMWHTVPTHWILSCLNIESPILEAFSFNPDGTYMSLNWVMKV